MTLLTAFAASRISCATPSTPCAVRVQDERRSLAQESARLEGAVGSSKAELAQFSANDPERFEALSASAAWQRAVGRCLAVVGSSAARLNPTTILKPDAPPPAAEQATVVARDSANRWTDNLFSVQTWMRKKFAGMDAQLADFFKEVRVVRVPAASCPVPACRAAYRSWCSPRAAADCVRAARGGRRL
jgi:hypothetical protein